MTAAFVNSLIQAPGLWVFIAVLIVWAVVTGVCFGRICVPQKTRRPRNDL